MLVHLGHAKMMANFPDGQRHGYRLRARRTWDDCFDSAVLGRVLRAVAHRGDEILAQNAEPGSTVEVDKVDRDQDVKDSEDEVRIAIVKPRKREAVGVGGGAPEAPEDGEAPEGSSEGDDAGSDEEDPARARRPAGRPDAPPAPESSEE